MEKEIRATNRNVLMDDRWEEPGKTAVFLYYRDVQPPTAFVEVKNVVNDVRFQVEVPEGVSPNDVFRNPYGYAVESMPQP